MSNGARSISYSAAAALAGVIISIMSAFSVWITIIYYYPSPALQDFTLIDMYKIIGLLFSSGSITAERLMGISLILYPIGVVAAVAAMKYRRMLGAAATAILIATSIIWLIGVRMLGAAATAYYTTTSSYGPYATIAAAVVIAAACFARRSPQSSER